MGARISGLITRAALAVIAATVKNVQVSVVTLQKLQDAILSTSQKVQRDVMQGLFELDSIYDQNELGFKAAWSQLKEEVEGAINGKLTAGTYSQLVSATYTVFRTNRSLAKKWQQGDFPKGKSLSSQSRSKRKAEARAATASRTTQDIAVAERKRLNKAYGRRTNTIVELLSSRDVIKASK